MDYIFDDWKKILEDFQNSVSKDLEEIHKQKNAVQQMKTDIFDRLDRGKYIRDEERLVLSAPEIVIGNVDKSGMLRDSGRVIIRGSNIDVEGAGKAGAITQRATTIWQIGVDPGIDGMEEAVYPHSAVITQARAVTLDSQNATDVFAEAPAAIGGSGICIHADQTLQVDASMSGDGHKKTLEERIKALKTQKDELTKLSSGQKSEIDKFFTSLKKLIGKEDDYIAKSSLIRVHVVEMDNLTEQVESLTRALYGVTKDFVHSVSQLAETNRQITALEKEKNAVKTGDAFAKEPTGASLLLQGERIEMLSHDGDGRLCTNDGGGISVHAPLVSVSMLKDDGTLLEGSAFGLATETVNISTANPKKDASELTGAGSVTISSKDIRLESMDYQKKDESMTEKGLAADGSISLAAKTVEVSAAQPSDVERDNKGKITKGQYKAEGDIILKSKTVSVETVDYEVAGGKHKTKALASGSTMLLLAENMFVGAEKKDVKSKKVQTVSQEVGLFADKTLETQQGDGKAIVQLADGKLGLSSSGNTVYGATEVKAELKAPKATIDNVEAKSAFKSPNISDGMAVGGAGGGSLSAKLKAEDAAK